MPFIDIFDRPDSGTVGNGWLTQEDVFSISNNQLIGVNGGTTYPEARIRRDVDVGPVAVEIRFIHQNTTGAVPSWLTVWTRVDESSNNGYYLSFGDSTAPRVVRDLNGGSWTILTPIDTNILSDMVNGDLYRFRLSSVGNIHRGWMDQWDSVGATWQNIWFRSGTDANLSTGAVGLSRYIDADSQYVITYFSHTSDSDAQAIPLKQNHHSLDSDAVALYSFLPGSLGIDTVGANEFTAIGDVDYEHFEYREGEGALKLNGTNAAMRITDVNQSYNFPLKFGQTNTTFSILGWFKASSIIGNQALFARSNIVGDRRCFWVGLDTANLSFTLGTGTGDGSENQYLDGTIAAGVWYHLKITLNERNWTIRVVNGDTEAVAITATGTATGDVPIVTEEWNIGAAESGTDDFFGGDIDEVVIFNRVVSDIDQDAIIAGDYLLPEAGIPVPTNLTTTQITATAARVSWTAGV